MTTQIGERFWTYYKDGVYGCTCFFCKQEILETEARWHSRTPTSVYACNPCFGENRIIPGLYPETHQVQFTTPVGGFVVEKAVEVPVTVVNVKPGRGVCRECKSNDCSYAFSEEGVIFTCKNCGEVWGYDAKTIASAKKVLADDAPTAQETREERISKAHDENMESAKQMRSMLSCLVSSIVDLTRQLEAMNK